MKKIAVFTSGGDAPGMNACIRAVVRSALHYKCEVVGILRGYEGMIEDEFITMNSRSVSNIIQRGGTILGSARSKAFRTKEGRQTAYQNLKKHGIDGVVAIGGDGTFTGADVFMSEYNDIPFVGVAGTIDNDLLGTDFTIGYDTAINTAMEAIDKIKDTASAHERVFFVEVMGRDAGFIAMRAGIATGAETILIPETRTNINEVVALLKANNKKKKNSSIIIVAEGDDEGGAFEIAEKVKKHLITSDIKVTILGHIQRGGKPTCMERVRASRLGLEAVKALLNGKSNVMVGEIAMEIIYTSFENAIKHNVEVKDYLNEMAIILA